MTTIRPHKTVKREDWPDWAHELIRGSWTPIGKLEYMFASVHVYQDPEWFYPTQWDAMFCLRYGHGNSSSRWWSGMFFREEPIRRAIYREVYEVEKRIKFLV